MAGTGSKKPISGETHVRVSRAPVGYDESDEAALSVYTIFVARREPVSTNSATVRGDVTAALQTGFTLTVRRNSDPTTW